MMNTFTVHTEAAARDVEFNKTRALCRCVFDSTLKNEWRDFVGYDLLANPTDLTEKVKEFAELKNIRLLGVDKRVDVKDGKYIILLTHTFGW